MDRRIGLVQQPRLLPRRLAAADHDHWLALNVEKGREETHVLTQSTSVVVKVTAQAVLARIAYVSFNIVFHIFEVNLINYYIINLYNIHADNDPCDFFIRNDLGVFTRLRGQVGELFRKSTLYPATVAQGAIRPQPDLKDAIRIDRRSRSIPLADCRMPEWEASQPHPYG